MKKEALASADKYSPESVMNDFITYYLNKSNVFDLHI